MYLRSLWAGLSTAALFATAITFSSTASAAPDCSIVDFSPETVAMGLNNSANVQFVVGTDCDEDAEFSWRLSGVWPNATGPAQPMVQNYPTDPFGKYYTYVPEGKFTWERRADYHTGVMPITVGGFIGEQKVENYLAPAKFDLPIVHRTTFGSTFNASPEPRRKGQTMRITAKLRYADWVSKTYLGLTADVVLQFRPLGSDEYVDVKKVHSNGVTASTTVKATKSGTWRYRYAGDGLTYGATNSVGDYVIVKPAQK